MVETRSQNKRAFTNLANQNVGSAARFHYELNCLLGVSMECLVGMFKLSNTNYVESQNMPDLRRSNTAGRLYVGRPFSPWNTVFARALANAIQRAHKHFIKQTWRQYSDHREHTILLIRKRANKGMKTMNSFPLSSLVISCATLQGKPLLTSPV